MRTLFFIFCALLLSFNSSASPDAYQKGLHYTEITAAHETGDDKKIIVYEFFSYKCGHCANFEPYMKRLEQELPSYAKIIRIPLGLQSSWKAFAQAYYTAEHMGLTEKSHQAIFDALHKHRKRLNSIEDIAQWFNTEFGTDKEQFLKVANSFDVSTKINKGNKMAQELLGVPRTPTLVIDGKYKPETTKLGSYQALVELTKHLVETQAQDKKL